MTCWLDLTQIWRGGSLDISNDLNNFWEEYIENKTADRGNFKKGFGRVILWTIA